MQRENFGGRFGALMAMAGSAVGLGNLWRFPYMVGTNGGGAFIFIYILCVFIICLPIFCAEVIIGRRSQANAFGAFKKLAPGTPWKVTGLLMVIIAMTIVSYYSVIGGWSVEYLIKAIRFEFTGAQHSQEALQGMFGNYISSAWKPLAGHTVFLGLTAYIVAGGVKKGIEKFGKFMMPLLFLIVIVIAIRSMTLPGAGEGIKYLFYPDFSKITPAVCADALGQAFFSLSLGVGTMLTYASYINKNENIVRFSTSTTITDFIFAIIASCAIMPAVFVFGISPQAGPGLAYETLPFIFSQMPIGGIIALLFFLALFVAALTSSISLFEVGVAYMVEQKNISRTKATIISFAITWCIGVVCSLSFGPLSNIKIFGDSIFGFLDKLSANIFMSMGALFIVIFVGWKMPRMDVNNEISNDGSIPFNRKIFPLFYFIVRYICPVAILVILISSIFA